MPGPATRINGAGSHSWDREADRRGLLKGNREEYRGAKQDRTEDGRLGGV